MRVPLGVCVVASVAIGSALTRAVAAEELPTSVMTMEPTVVTAERITETEARAPTVFSSTIETAPHIEQMETTADVLAESVGVQVRRFGGLGTFSTVSIRGSAANQVQVYLDGIPLSLARNETVNVANLPLDSLQRIEVYRGTAPIEFATPGIGGVINLVTKSPSVAPATEAMTSYGSFETRRVDLSHSQPFHGVDLLGFVTYLGSAGDFPFLDDNGTPLNPFDDREVTRQNNGFNSVEGLLKAGHALPNGLRVDLASDTFFKDEGVPGIGSNQSRTASLDDLRSVNYLRVRAPDWSPQLTLSSTLFGVYERQSFEDRKGEIGTGNQDRRDATTLIGGNLSATYQPVIAHTVSAFAEISDQRFAPSNALGEPADEPDQTRLQIAAALQHQAAFFSERFLLVPAVRYVHLEDDITAALTPTGLPLGAPQHSSHDLWNPSMGTRVALWPGLEVRANVGRFERAPNFSELFGNRGVVVGNNSLQPEKGPNWDVGAVAAVGPWGWLDGLHAEYAYFNNNVTDLIVLVQNSQHVSKPLNIGAARVSGDEFSLKAGALTHIRLETNFTHYDAENRSDIPSQRGKQLPGRPANDLYTHVEFYERRGRVYYEFNLVSGNFLDLVNFKSVPTRDTHTFGWVWQVTDHLGLSFEARNVTNNQISDVAGFPLPGRAFFGGATLRF
jgi:outer membrane cobalamin receptor